MSRFMSLVAMVCLAQLASEARGQVEKSPPPKLDRFGDPLPAGAIARLGTLRLRHDGDIAFIGYSRDGALITAGGDGAIHFWDSATGKEARRLQGKPRSDRHRRFKRSREEGITIHLSGDGTTLLAATEQPFESQVIDTATGKEIHRLKLAEIIGKNNELLRQLSHDGRLLACIIHTEIVVVETATGKLVGRFTAKGTQFAGAALSADNKTLISTESADGDKKGELKESEPVKPRLRYWDVGSGKELRSSVIDGNISGQLDIIGTSLLTRDRIGASRLLDGNGKELRMFGEAGMVRGSVLAPDRKSLFLANGQLVVRLDLATGKNLGEYSLGEGAAEAPNSLGLSVLPLAVSPDGKTLSAADHCRIVSWNVGTRKKIGDWESHRQRIDSVAFSPIDKQVLTGSADGRLCLWDGRDARLRRELTSEATSGDVPGGMFLSMLFQVRGGFLPDGKVIGMRPGGRLSIWDPRDAKKPRLDIGDAGDAGDEETPGSSFAVSPDGRWLAVGSRPGVIRLYDAGGRQRKTLGAAPAKEDEREVQDRLHIMTFSPDSRRLIVASFTLRGEGFYASIRQWELAAGRVRAQFEDGGEVNEQNFSQIVSVLDSMIGAILFSPDGKLRAEAGFSSIKLRDAHTGRELRTFGGQQVATATAQFSPDGKLLVAGKHDGRLRIWDVAGGTVLGDIPAHAGGVTALAFSRDGQWLASGSRDTTVLIWDWEHLRRQVAVPERLAVLPHEKLWTDLAGNDAERAHQAIMALARTPAETAAFIKERLRPVPAVDARRVEQLLADLDEREFNKRKKAEQELEKLGDLAAAAIKKRLAGSPTLEMARRLESLLRKLDSQEMPADVLQALRAIESLEMIASPAARQVLERLAQGAAGHRITEDARETLRRLGRD